MSDSALNCAVTGGCGFIGSHLVRRLAGLGARRVTVIDSLEYGQRINLDPLPSSVSIQEHRLSGESLSSMRKCLSGVDVLFHLAAEKHNQSINTPLKVIDANISGTQALLQAAAECRVKKVVFASSLYSYGRMSGAPFTEDETPGPLTLYGISKLAGEHLCRMFHIETGLSAICLRYLFVYGPRQYANLGYKSVIVKTFQRLIEGVPPIINGDGMQTLDYVYVDDAVEAAVRAAAAPLGFEVLNVSTGQGTKVKDLVEMMQTVAGTRLEPVHAPADRTAGSYRVGDPSKLRTVLNFTPGTPLMAGLARTYRWILESRPV